MIGKKIRFTRLGIPMVGTCVRYSMNDAGVVTRLSVEAHGFTFHVYPSNFIKVIG